jgi:hypothetical protein
MVTMAALVTSERVSANVFFDPMLLVQGVERQSGPTARPDRNPIPGVWRLLEAARQSLLPFRRHEIVAASRARQHATGLRPVDGLSCADPGDQADPVHVGADDLM